MSTSVLLIPNAFSFLTSALLSFSHLYHSWPPPTTYFHDVKTGRLIILFMFYSSSFPIFLYSTPSRYFFISALHIPSPFSLEFVASNFVRKYRVSKLELRHSPFQIICSGLIHLSSKYLTMPNLSYQQQRHLIKGN